MDSSKTVTSAAALNLDRSIRSAYKLFKKFDTDKSGSLEYDEIMTMLKACNIDISPEECQDCLKCLDSNGDGAWDFTEFMTFLGMIYSVKLNDGSTGSNAQSIVGKPDQEPTGTQNP